MSRLGVTWSGTEKLINELERKNSMQLKKIESKNLLEMRNRAVRTKVPSMGGTPVGNYKGGGELRLDAKVDLNAGVMGYTKHYAPHVEYGHRLVRGGVQVGYVPGQYFLKNNMRIQEPIFRNDLRKELNK